MYSRQISDAEKIVNAIDALVPMSNEWKEWMTRQFIRHGVDVERTLQDINSTPLNRVFARIIIWPNNTMHIWRLLHKTKCTFELQIILNTPIIEISNGLNTGKQNEELSFD